MHTRKKCDSVTLGQAVSRAPVINLTSDSDSASNFASDRLFQKYLEPSVNEFEKACQRSPVGAKMWNSHILCKLEQNLV